MTISTPNNYVQSEAALNKLTEAVSRVTTQRDQAIGQLRTVETSLQRLSQGSPAGYADLVVFVRNQATADPQDAQWAYLKGRIDKIVADFQDERQLTTAILAAIDGV